MPQDPAEYAILCTQADADDAPAIGKSVLQQAMQIPGLMCAMKAADADVTDALVAVSRVARQLEADAVQPVLSGNACERCAVEDRHLDHGVTCGLPGNLRRQADRKSTRLNSSH